MPEAATGKPGLTAQTPDVHEGVVLSPSPGGAESTHLVKALGVCALIPVSGPRDRRIAMIAEAQQGRVSRRQLRAAGIGENAIDRLVAKRRLHRLHTGVYAVGHLAPTALGAETAALLACREGAVLSHRTAARLWKLRPAHDDNGAVDVMILGRQTARPVGVCVHRTRLLTPGEVRVRCRLPVTSPARALLDIAELVSERELERALDEGLVSRVVRVAEVTDVLSRATGRHGAPLLAGVLDRRSGPTITRSEAEEKLLALIGAAQLPHPEVNVRVHGFEVDFLWREQRVVVEVDGYRYHASRSAFERDRAKGAKLTAAGLNVMRVTWLQMDEESHAVIARLAQALVRAELRLAG